MNEQEIWFWVIAIALVLGALAVLGAIARFFLGEPIDDYGENVGAGCFVIIPIALILAVVYGIVRFVKFAWSD
jgi:hypothetical protein